MFDQRSDYVAFPALDTINGAILVIDDDSAIRDALTDILGFLTEAPVYSAANGYEGLQILQQEEPEIALIFLDMNMPVMNGEETYDRLQQIAPDVKVIISSSLSLAEAQHRLGYNQPSAFLQKPFDIKTLLQTLIPLFAVVLPITLKENER